MTTAQGPIRVPAEAQGLPMLLLRLARPAQWIKGLFVLVGPLYGGRLGDWSGLLAAAGAFLAFGFASSACYVINDLRDRDADRAHPRKRNRPIASGAVTLGTAHAFSNGLLVLAAAALSVVWLASPEGLSAGLWTAGAVGIYVGNVVLYSLWLKHAVIADVISLALGFVLRVLGGCAAVGIEPSSWLLNVTFFIAMFLAFGKRLGERRTMGDDAASARQVQAKYTDDLLRMVVVVTGVATLLTYAGYVQSQAAHYTQGFNLLWLTMLPATYGLLRCIVLVERGTFDDPTELAVRDRPFQAAGVLFVGLTLGLMLTFAAPTAPERSGGAAATGMAGSR